MKNCLMGYICYLLDLTLACATRTRRRCQYKIQSHCAILFRTWFWTFLNMIERGRSLFFPFSDVQDHYLWDTMSKFSPPLWHILPILHPLLLYLWRISHDIHQTACISMCLISLPLSSWYLGLKRHSVVFLFIFLLWWWCFWSILFGAMTWRVGRIYS